MSINHRAVPKTTALSRRKALKLAGASAAAVAAGTMFPMPAITQQRKLKYTLPWLAQGSFVYVYVAKHHGFLAKRGLDIDISRGFGSVAAAQTIAAGQFDIGTVTAPPLVMSIANGLPLFSVGTVDYEATMGVGVPTDSPIRKPSDLVGKKVGAAPTSGEYPFFPAFCKRAGIDASKIELVHMDNKVLERALIEKQVDAIMGFAGSSLPVLLSKGEKVRFMLYRAAGLVTYGNCITVTKKTYEADPGMCEAMVDGMMEALKFTLLDPEAAKEIFYKAVPEIALSSTGKEFTKLGLGIMSLGVTKTEAKTNGLAWADAKIFGEMTDVIMEYVAKPGMKRPAAEEIFTNKFAGKTKLTAAEWAKADGFAKPFESLLS